MSEPIDDPADLVPDYLAGGLTSEEERALFASAASDQDIFNQLMEAEALRNALSSPEQRNRLKAALEALEGDGQPQCVADCDDLEGLEFAPGGTPRAKPSPSVPLVALSTSGSARPPEGRTVLWYTNRRVFAAVAAGIALCVFISYAGFRSMHQATSDPTKRSVRRVLSPLHPELSADNRRQLFRPDEDDSALPGKQALTKMRSAPGNPTGSAKQPTQIGQLPPGVAALAPGRSSDLVGGAEASAGLQSAVVEQVVSPAGYSADGATLPCGGNAEALQIVNAAAAVLSSGDVSYAGAFAPEIKVRALVGQDLIAEMLGHINHDRTMPCHPLIAVIPTGSQIVRFQYSARDRGGESPCNPDGKGGFICGIGKSKFAGPPIMTPAGKSMLVTGMFVNWSHARERAANLTVYYRRVQ